MFVDIGEYGAGEPFTGACVAALEVDTCVLARAVAVVENTLVNVLAPVRRHGEAALTLAQERARPVS